MIHAYKPVPYAQKFKSDIDISAPHCVDRINSKSNIDEFKNGEGKIFVLTLNEL